MNRKRSIKEATPSAPAPRLPQDATTGASDSLFSERLRLNLLVFWAGAVLMGLEIAGSRVLAPYFGNSVFVWGSLISVVLIAISLGNYFGGRVADRYPVRILLNLVCIAVSLWIFLVAIFSRSFCQLLVEEGIGEQSGPLVASLVLFLPPSVGMGMVSPFAIRLAAHSVTSIGKISGTLYALSTMGSIAGTMLTTFILVPWIGVAAILKGLGLSLLIVSVVTISLHKARQAPERSIAVGVLAMALLFWQGPPASPLLFGEKSVVEMDSPYQHISVVDNARRNSRDLRFDHFIESSISKTPPYAALSDYTNYFQLAFLVQPKIERTLFIGAGGAIGPRAFHMHDPAMVIDVVDIDAKVLAVARTHFFLDESAQLATVAEDGRMFLRATSHRYDCIILDAFTIGGRIPFHLVTKEFLELCRDKMTEHGVFIMNINSAITGPSSHIFASMHNTLDAVFPNVYVFAKDHQAWGRDRSMNVILLAGKDADRVVPAEWAARAETYRSASYIKQDRMRQIARDLVEDVPDVASLPNFSQPIFTDDYAPIETMSF